MLRRLRPWHSDDCLALSSFTEATLILGKVAGKLLKHPLSSECRKLVPYPLQLSGTAGHWR